MQLFTKCCFDCKKAFNKVINISGSCSKKRFISYNLAIQFVILKPLSYYFEETIEFDLMASFASCLVSRLIKWYSKPSNITKNFDKRLFTSTGFFMDWKLQTVYLKTSDDFHCLRSGRIRSVSGPYFPAFGLNTRKYGPEKLRIWTLFYDTQCFCWY